MLSEARSTVFGVARERLSFQRGVKPSKFENVLFMRLISKRLNSSSARTPLKSIYIYSSPSVPQTEKHSPPKAKTSVPLPTEITSPSMRQVPFPAMKSTILFSFRTIFLFITSRFVSNTKCEMRIFSGQNAVIDLQIFILSSLLSVGFQFQTYHFFACSVNKKRTILNIFMDFFH